MQYLISFEGHKICLPEKDFKIVFLKNYNIFKHILNKWNVVSQIKSHKIHEGAFSVFSYF